MTRWRKRRRFRRTVATALQHIGTGLLLGLVMALAWRLMDRQLEGSLEPDWSINEKSGAISLPLDAYGLSYGEGRQLDYVRELALGECLRAAGYQFDPIDRRSEPPPRSRRYGVWSVESAAARGYLPPPKTRGELQQEAASRELASWRGERLIALQGCSATADAFNVVQPLSSDTAARALHHEVLSSDMGKSVVAEWRRCLTKAGVEMDEESMWISVRFSIHLTRDHVADAVKDARCKIRTRLVERLAGLEAKLQRNFIADHSPALRDQRSKVEAALERASAYLDSRIR